MRREDINQKINKQMHGKKRRAREREVCPVLRAVLIMFSYRKKSFVSIYKGSGTNVHAHRSVKSSLSWRSFWFGQTRFLIRQRS